MAKKTEWPKCLYRLDKDGRIEMRIFNEEFDYKKDKWAEEPPKPQDKKAKKAE